MLQKEPCKPVDELPLSFHETTSMARGARSSRLSRVALYGESTIWRIQYGARARRSWGRVEDGFCAPNPSPHLYIVPSSRWSSTLGRWTTTRGHQIQGRRVQARQLRRRWEWRRGGRARWKQQVVDPTRRRASSPLAVDLAHQPACSPSIADLAQRRFLCQFQLHFLIGLYKC